ncbi:MAG TPA: hypothetical protein VIU93_01220 [Gallionellaceae bacterium]
MNRASVIISVLAWLGMSSFVRASELLPWQTENIDIPTPGVYSVEIDDRSLFFEVPTDSAAKVSRASKVVTRGEKYDDWLKRNGEYQKGCFGMSWNSYWLGLPLFGSYAQFSILAKVHIKSTPKQRNLPGIYDWDRGDFNKPIELFENLRRSTNYYVDKSKYDASTHLLHFYSPVKEVLINGRRWFHYYQNTSLYPEILREYYVTGLAPDRYLEIIIMQYPVPLKSIGYPYPATGYPTYPTEDQMPAWMKRTHKYKEQVINSIRIEKPAGSYEPDLYEIEADLPTSAPR